MEEAYSDPEPDKHMNKALSANSFQGRPTLISQMYITLAKSVF